MDAFVVTPALRQKPQVLHFFPQQSVYNKSIEMIRIVTNRYD